MDIQPPLVLPLLGKCTMQIVHFLFNHTDVKQCELTADMHSWFVAFVTTNCLCRLAHLVLVTKY